MARAPGRILFGHLSLFFRFFPGSLFCLSLSGQAQKLQPRVKDISFHGLGEPVGHADSGGGLQEEGGLAHRRMDGAPSCQGRMAEVVDKDAEVRIQFLQVPDHPPHLFEVKVLQGGVGPVLLVMHVAVEGGFIAILSLQLPGKKRLKIDELLRGYKITNEFCVK